MGNTQGAKSNMCGHTAAISDADVRFRIAKSAILTVIAISYVLVMCEVYVDNFKGTISTT